MSFARIAEGLRRAQIERTISEIRTFLRDKLGFFDQQIDAAEHYVRHVFLKQEKSGVILLPMQAGKTGCIIAIFKMLQAFVPDVAGVFVCARCY